MTAVVMMARFSMSSEDGGQTEGERVSLEERNGKSSPKTTHLPAPGRASPWS